MSFISFCLIGEIISLFEYYFVSKGQFPPLPPGRVFLHIVILVDSFSLSILNILSHSLLACQDFDNTSAYSLAYDVSLFSCCFQNSFLSLTLTVVMCVGVILLSSPYESFGPKQLGYPFLPQDMGGFGPFFFYMYFSCLFFLFYVSGIHKMWILFPLDDVS